MSEVKRYAVYDVELDEREPGGALPNPAGDNWSLVVMLADHNALCDQLATALRKCIETFDDMQRVLRLLNRPVLADACAVAADSSRDVLNPKVAASPPYPWCRQPSVCRGTCPMDPSCGE